MKILKYLENNKVVEFSANKDGQLLISTYPGECDCDKEDEITINTTTLYLDRNEALEMIHELIEIIKELPDSRTPSDVKLSDMTKAEEIIKGSTLLSTIKSEFSKGNSEDLEKDLLRMVNRALSQHDVMKNELAVCKHIYKIGTYIGRTRYDVCEKCGDHKEDITL